MRERESARDAPYARKEREENLEEKQANHFADDELRCVHFTSSSSASSATGFAVDEHTFWQAGTPWSAGERERKKVRVASSCSLSRSLRWHRMI